MQEPPSFDQDKTSDIPVDGVRLEETEFTFRKRFAPVKLSLPVRSPTDFRRFRAMTFLVCSVAVEWEWSTGHTNAI